MIFGQDIIQLSFTKAAYFSPVSTTSFFFNSFFTNIIDLTLIIPGKAKNTLFLIS